MILLLSDDLLDASKTIGTARAGGADVFRCKTPAVLLDQLAKCAPDCCILDLQCPDFDIDQFMPLATGRTPRPRIIAYGSHVDAARLAAARAAGCDEVFPRSKYFNILPARIADWTSGPKKSDAGEI